MNIVGFGFKSGVGKDTCADYLVEQFGYHKISFADSLKASAYHHFKNIGVQPEEYYEGDFKETRRKETYGPYNKTIVEIWVDMNLLCRVNPRLWIDLTFENLEPNGKYVISDVRKPLEIEAINSLNGHTIWIQRTVPPRPEAKIDLCMLGNESMFDYEINNDGIFMETAIQLGGIIESINATLE